MLGADGRRRYKNIDAETKRLLQEFFAPFNQRLFRLLANRDRLTTAEGDELARAEFLIARSYMLQAEAISARQEGSR